MAQSRAQPQIDPGAVPAAAVYPRSALLFYMAAHVVAPVGERVEMIADGSFVWFHFGEINGSGGSAQNDEWQLDVTLDAGTYDLRVMGQTGPNAGILTLDLKRQNEGGFTALATPDFYSGGFVANVETAAISITIPTGGRHVLRGRTLTKNASASAYRMRLQNFLFTPITPP